MPLKKIGGREKIFWYLFSYFLYLPAVFLEDLLFAFKLTFMNVGEGDMGVVVVLLSPLFKHTGIPLSIYYFFIFVKK